MDTFKPDLTPERMLFMGIFGGNYFANATEADFEGMRPSIVALAKQDARKYDKKNNYYGVKAGKSYEWWNQRGWIFEEDPLGWFQWYCRYDSGRRHERDAHQIDRHARYLLRWGTNARNQANRKGYVSPVVLQGLLQWGMIGYDVSGEN